VNILNKQSWTTDKGWSSSFWGLGKGLTSPHHKNKFVKKCHIGLQNCMDGPVTGSCEHSNEPSGSIKDGTS
jgi:hypothetical protein